MKFVPRTLRSAPPFAAWCAAVPDAGAWYGPGSAEQREERCTASGTLYLVSSATRPIALRSISNRIALA